MPTSRHFRLLRRLGGGSFGNVYLAEMESQGGFRTQVALKVLNPAAEQSTDSAQRLRDEARMLGRLRHRHIVRVEERPRGPLADGEVHVLGQPPSAASHLQCIEPRHHHADDVAGCVENRPAAVAWLDRRGDLKYAPVNLPVDDRPVARAATAQTLV